MPITERLYQFDSKTILDTTDIIYIGNSLNSYNEVQTTVAGLIAAYPGLLSIATLTTSANQMIYTTGSNVFSTSSITSFGRSVVALSQAVTTPTSGALAGWDSNLNLSANNFLSGFNITVTAAGTTTLTVSSAAIQEFTGSTTQTVVMPDVSTLKLGQSFRILNDSSGILTVNSSGGDLISNIAGGSQLVLTCIALTGTDDSPWRYASSGSSSVFSATGTENQVLINGTFGVAEFGPLIFTLPQDIASTSSPTFDSLSLTNPLAIADGGTSVTSVTTTPTASAWSGWDSDKNMSANNFHRGFQTTITSGGTTTLTAASAGTQEFTGTLTQTVVLPVVSTIPQGTQFVVVNNSSGNVTVNSSGGNLVLLMAANTTAFITSVLTVGTSAASWNSSYLYDFGAGVESITGTANQVIASSATGAVTLSLPQDIGTSSAVEFASVQFSTNQALLDSNGSTMLGIQTASTPAVDYLQLVNAASGFVPTLRTDGASSNIDMGFQPKGSGDFQFVSGALTNQFGFYFNLISSYFNFQSSSGGPFTYTWPALSGTVPMLSQVGATLIQSTTITIATASLIVTNLSAYKEVWFYINALVPATDGAYPILNVSYDNGSTWDTSANYNSQRAAFSGSTTTTANAGGQTSFNPAATIGMDNGTFSPCGYVYFGGLQWTQRKPIQSSFMFYDASLSLFMTLCNGEINTVNAINAIRLQMNTGNINNLNVDIYGMK